MTRLTELADLLAALETGAGCRAAPDPAGLAGPGGPAGWLAQVVTALFCGQEPAVASAWAMRTGPGLVRLGSRVPFSVVHDWHARTVIPLLGGVCADQEAACALHGRALGGSRVTEAEWAAALEPALRPVYHRAYAYDQAYRVNYESAMAYGTANGFGEQGTREYAAYYAGLATGANRRAFADASAIACARACAAAFATADPVAYAGTCPYAAARAYARALAGGGPDGGRGVPEPTAYRRLADGLAASLGRA
jgi:hypothetical protein